MTYQPISEPIQVVAFFSKGKLQPLAFRWGLRDYKIARITGRWRVSVGKYKLHHFGVMDSQDNYCELCYSEEDFTWTIIQTWNEG